MSIKGYVAFDLGAESGRAMLATIQNGKVELEELHRFLNNPQRLPSGYHWNLQELWGNLVEGLRVAGKVAKERGVELVSLGVDTWGVDHGFIGKSGQLLGLPFAYRDDRNDAAMAAVLEKIDETKLYEATGLQLMPFNSLFQVFAQQQAEPDVLAAADAMLTMPDLLHYFFSGVKVNEATNASTTQMIDPRTGDWNRELLDELGIPHHFLKDIVPAGTKIGSVRPELAEQVGIDPIDVIVPGSHDTASAIAAVPVDVNEVGDRWAYLSSGTWSLMGAELDSPKITAKAQAAPFTHERGVANKIRFLKNIAGLWLVQEVRRDYLAQGTEYDYVQLTQAAAEAEPFRLLMDPNHEPFSNPGGMLAKIDAYAEATGQPKPENVGHYVRACLETLAMCYRQTLEQLVDVMESPIDVLHLVGGGGKNAVLNQMTADAIGRPVIVGPYEGTAMGNALTQAIGAGDIADLSALREIVRNSTELLTFEPKDTAAFDAQYERYLGLAGR